MVNGILYFSTPDNAWAVDARSGREIWHYAWKTKGGVHIGNRACDCFLPAPIRTEEQLRHPGGRRQTNFSSRSIDPRVQHGRSFTAGEVEVGEIYSARRHVIVRHDRGSDCAHRAQQHRQQRALQCSFHVHKAGHGKSPDRPGHSGRWIRYAARRAHEAGIFPILCYRHTQIGALSVLPYQTY